MRQIGRDEAVEGGDEPMSGVWGKVEPELLDGDEPSGVWLIGPEDRAENAGADLMKHPEGAKSIRGRGAGSVRVQR